MLRSILPSRYKSGIGPGSRMAMAVALAGGAVLAVSGVAAPAQAAKKAASQDYSKDFVKAYKPVADALNAENADVAAIRPQIPAVVAAASTPDDQFAAGQLVLSTGSKAKDQALQRQGLTMMLASGQTPPEQVGQFNFFVGQLAYEAKDYGTARAALQKAIAAGYTENDPRPLVAETYFGENNPSEGLTYLKSIIDQNKAAGQPVPENWLMRGLKVAYQSKNPQLTDQWAGMLIANHPTPQNWTNAIQVVAANHKFDDQQYLDLLRLRRKTGSLDQANDYKAYIQTADARRMPNEVLAVVNEGIAAGTLSADEPLVVEAKQIAESRAASDRTETPKLVSEARSAAGGKTAMGLGEAFFSFGDYKNSAEMYQLALQKGVQNIEQVTMRLGIAQALAGNCDSAKQTFTQVTGPRAPVANLWTIWVDNQMNGTAVAG